MTSKSDSFDTSRLRGMFIDGREVMSASGDIIDVVNPSSGQVFAQVTLGDARDVDIAVAAGKRAFESGIWSQMRIQDRARIMNRFADGIERRMQELYLLETQNNGRPITETKAQITRLHEWYRYNAALLLADRDSVVPMPD